MPTYRLLIHPSASRVYARSAPALAAAELRTVADLVLPGLVGDIEAAPVGPAAALRFTTSEELSADAARVVAAGAGAYLLFSEHGRDGHLAPLDAAPPACLPDDLLTIPRYPGKTNERFTGLMVNLALAAADRGLSRALEGEPVRLLDPLCGRGTTLSQALVYGLDAVGIEERDKEVASYLGTVRQWLRDHRIKHRSEAETLRKGPGRDRTARRTTVTIAPPGGHRQLALLLVSDDTVRAREHVRRSSVDVVVGDLPYGVQHASRTDDTGRSRHPAGLLREALPAWRTVLRGGGAVCLAFNTNVIDRDDVDAELAAAGLRPVDAAADGRFAHRVDQAIRRDVALAVKPR